MKTLQNKKSNVVISRFCSAMTVRFQTPLEEVEGQTLLERMLEFLNRDENLRNKQLFQDYEKDRGLLMKVDGKWLTSFGLFFSPPTPPFSF
jgi:hypothetical protein